MPLCHECYSFSSNSMNQIYSQILSCTFSSNNQCSIMLFFACVLIIVASLSSSASISTVLTTFIYCIAGLFIKWMMVG